METRHTSATESDPEWDPKWEHCETDRFQSIEADIVAVIIRHAKMKDLARNRGTILIYIHISRCWRKVKKLKDTWGELRHNLWWVSILRHCRKILRTYLCGGKRWLSKASSQGSMMSKHRKHSSRFYNVQVDSFNYIDIVDYLIALACYCCTKQRSIILTSFFSLGLEFIHMIRFTTSDMQCFNDHSCDHDIVSCMSENRKTSISDCFVFYWITYTWKTPSRKSTVGFIIYIQ